MSTGLLGRMSRSSVPCWSADPVEDCAYEPMENGLGSPTRLNTLKEWLFFLFFAVHVIVHCNRSQVRFSVRDYK